MIRYLAADDILVIHALVIEETGGSDGVREPDLLASIAHRAQASFWGREVHPDIFAKAAAFGEAIINYHVFVDGNKRTALIAIGRFLNVNGYELTASSREAEQAMLAIAEKRMDERSFAVWLKEHSRPPSQSRGRRS